MGLQFQLNEGIHLITKYLTDFCFQWEYSTIFPVLYHNVFNAVCVNPESTNVKLFYYIVQWHLKWEKIEVVR